jgi:nitrogen fixation NifU-like protein
MYSERLLDHFEHPRNVGELEPPALVVETENPACGDILRLSAEVSEGRFVRVLYRTRGCTASIAAGSALTELLTGRGVEQAARLAAAEVETALGGLPNESKHAAVLAADAARALSRAASSVR